MLKIEIYVFSAFLPSFIIQYVHIHAVGYVHCSPYGEFNMEIYYTCFWLLPFIIISSSPNWFMCITFWFDCTLPNMLYGCSCWWNFTDLHVHFLSLSTCFFDWIRDCFIVECLYMYMYVCEFTRGSFDIWRFNKCAVMAMKID